MILELTAAPLKLPHHAIAADESVLVNLDNVTTIHPYDKGGCIVFFTGQTALQVTESREEIRSMIGKVHGIRVAP